MILIKKKDIIKSEFATIQSQCILLNQHAHTCVKELFLSKFLWRSPDMGKRKCDFADDSEALCKFYDYFDLNETGHLLCMEFISLLFFNGKTGHLIQEAAHVL